MLTIHKYPLLLCNRQQIQIPKVWKFLHVDVQHGQICLWFLVDTTEEKESVTVHIIGTGNEVPEFNLVHLGTVLMDSFVWHIFVEQK